MVILWTSVVDSVVLLTTLSVVLSGTPTTNANEKNELCIRKIHGGFDIPAVSNLWIEMV